MNKVGFFGGSFDPIHIGHVNLAIELMEKKRTRPGSLLSSSCLSDQTRYSSNSTARASYEHAAPQFRGCSRV